MTLKYKRHQFETILARLQESRRFIQILFGPRQVGKTTLIEQVLEHIDVPFIFASTDAEAQATGLWLTRQWDRARFKVRDIPGSAAVLILDEVQKIPDWGEYVKKEWDADSRMNLNIKVVLLGSSSLLIQQGITESLAGRFELIRIPHWSYTEMNQAFGTSLDEYIFFGGYPGATDLISNEPRWKQYVRDALIEPAITKDVLLMTRVDKPALLRQLFHLGAVNSGKIISYTKLLGQLQDGGNTTTLAHYLNLLNTAGLLAGMQKFSGSEIRTRASSPKFQTFNTALTSALDSHGFKESRPEPDAWGHYFESAVGAHLINSAYEQGYRLTYWRDGNYEVDYILSKGDRSVAIEVKSGKKRDALNGMNRFVEQFKPFRSLVVGTNGIPIEEFFSTPIETLFE
jgi:predicted AAA+ superfamily ATPase